MKKPGRLAMPQRWFAFGGLTLLGLVFFTGAYPKDDAKSKTEAAVKAKN
jgi:hypothetical protein